MERNTLVFIVIHKMIQSMLKFLLQTVERGGRKIYNKGVEPNIIAWITFEASKSHAGLVQVIPY